MIDESKATQGAIDAQRKIEAEWLIEATKLAELQAKKLATKGVERPTASQAERMADIEARRLLLEAKLKGQLAEEETEMHGEQHLMRSWVDACSAAEKGDSQPLEDLLVSDLPMPPRVRLMLADMHSRHQLARKPGNQKIPITRLFSQEISELVKSPQARHVLKEMQPRNQLTGKPGDRKAPTVRVFDPDFALYFAVDLVRRERRIIKQELKKVISPVEKRRLSKEFSQIVPNIAKIWNLDVKTLQSAVDGKLGSFNRFMKSNRKRFFMRESEQQ